MAPGWRGGAAQVEPYVAGLRRLGFAADALELPIGPAERAVPAFLSLAGPRVVAAGVSFGGRVATLAAAEQAFAGVIAFSFPLRGQAERRTAHWPRIGCPALIVNGRDDDWAPGPELVRVMPRLRAGRLVQLAGAGHDLRPMLEQALSAAAAFLAELS
ncbi:MAG: alpha/beta family hydrolase [Candidatus Dormibacter sp.]|uniref:alpha/beta family hydrolase n=1 Tax=Candidatus Dormibacter sp. TaxID=2973982 RepID=UPI000DB69CBD|nr:MAG: hypothetical protein DLM66_02790 [Candidatus Dormibacteraeota bacterium]